MKMNRQELLDALTKIKPGLANKEIVEQSKSFLFLKGQVVSYNDEIAISHPITGKLRGAVKSQELYALLSKLTDDELEMEVTENELLVNGRRSQSGIALEADINKGTADLLDEVLAERDWKLLPSSFCDAVSFCLFTAGNDMTKPMLTCIHVTPKHAESCDNLRFTRYSFNEKHPMKDSFLLPSKAAALLIKYKPKQYAIDKGWLHFNNEDDVQFSCRTVEGEYPNLESFIPKKGAKFTLPAAVHGALERAGVFLDEKTGTALVDISISKDNLKIHAQGPGGWIDEKVRVKYDGDAIEFKIKPTFLQEILVHLQDVVITDRVLMFAGEGFVHCCIVSA